MAINFERYELGHNGRSINLLSGPLTIESRQVEVDDGRLLEILTLNHAADSDERRQAITQLETLLNEARAHNNGRFPHPTYITSNEAREGLRQTYVYDGRYNAEAHTLTLHRHHHSETPETTAVSGSAVSALGGLVELPAAANAPGRVARMLLQTASAGVAPVLQVYYIGIKPKQPGEVSTSFVATHDLVAGGGPGSTDEAGSTPPNDTHNNTFVEVAIVGSGENQIVAQVELRDAGITNYSHMIGSFFPMLRGRTLTNTTVRLDLWAHWGTAISPIGGEGVKVGSLFLGPSFANNYNLHPFPPITLPVVQTTSPAESERSIETLLLQLRATWLSGSGNLNLDCLSFLPAAHQFSTTTTINNSNVTLGLLHTTTPGDQPYSALVIDDSGTLVAVHHPNAGGRAFYAPPEGGVIVLLAQHPNQHRVASTIDIDLDINPRWQSFRREEASW